MLLHSRQDLRKVTQMGFHNKLMKNKKGAEENGKNNVFKEIGENKWVQSLVLGLPGCHGKGAAIRELP